MSWRAIQTKPAAERRVADGLRDEGLTAFLPVERVWRWIRGRKHQHARPLIPGYVFAYLADHELHHIHAINGAVRFVGADGSAAVIPTLFIEQLQSALDAGKFDHTISHTKALEKGQTVLVLEGPYAGYVGAIAKLKGSRRVQLLLTLANGRQWAVTEQVEKLELLDVEKAKRKAA